MKMKAKRLKMKVVTQRPLDTTTIPVELPFRERLTQAQRLGQVMRWSPRNGFRFTKQ